VVSGLGCLYVIPWIPERGRWAWYLPPAEEDAAEAGTGKELHRFDGHTAEVLSVVISPDGRRAVSGGKDRAVRLWDLARVLGPKAGGEGRR
jgi:WD40 repeat protein